MRFLRATAVQYEWHRKALDVRTAFLNADLEEKVFVSQPEVFENKQNPQKGDTLHRALYRLEQALRQWFRCTESPLSTLGF